MNLRLKYYQTVICNVRKMDFNLKIQIYVLGLQEPISLFGQSTYKRLHIL